MPISRRVFLRSGAQALSAASLVAAMPKLAVAADKDQKSVNAKDLSVKDVAGLALISGAGCNVVGLAAPDGESLRFHRTVRYMGGHEPSDSGRTLDGQAASYCILLQCAEGSSVARRTLC